MSPRYLDEAELAAREDHVLDQALMIIDQHGLSALTIDKIVAVVEYSKGTVYNHFNSKEDVLTALCNRNMRTVYTSFCRAVAIDRCERHKMMAISFAYMLKVVLNPQSFHLMMNAKTEIFEKASAKRSEEHEQLDKQLFDICNGVIHQAIIKQELQLKPGMDERAATFAVYAMCFGTIGLLLKQSGPCQTTMGALMEDSVLAHCNIVKDGLGWAPAKTSDATLIQYLKEHTFADEMLSLSQQGIRL